MKSLEALQKRSGSTRGLAAYWASTTAYDDNAGTNNNKGFLHKIIKLS